MASGGTASRHVAAYSTFDAQQPPSALAVSKRLKACIRCRDLKLRCKPIEGHSNTGCERCVAARRECIFPVAARRSRKAGKGTVAALEQRVNALVSKVTSLTESRAALEESGGRVHRDATDSTHTGSFVNAIGLRSIDGKRGLSDDFHSNQLLPSGLSLDLPESSHMQSKKRMYPESQSLFSFFRPRCARTDDLFQNDVVCRGIVSLKDAQRVYDRFTKSMLPHFPVIILPEETTVSILRRTKPALFLAILGVASAILGQEIQELLAKEVIHSFADRLIIRGEKDLDLVQAVQVSAVWCHPPEHYEELKIYQIVHIAAIMSVELGFGQVYQPSISRLPSFGTSTPSHSIHRDTLSKETLIERQRAWLGCYFLCSILSMMARCPPMLRWTPYIDHCISSLENCPNALESDKLLCHWVRGQGIAEQIGQNFSMDDPSAEVDASDVKVQYVLRGFEQQLDRWRSQIPVEVQTPTLQSSASVINLYLHEIVLHVGHNVNDFRPPFIEECVPPPSSTRRPQLPTLTQRSSLAICFVSVKDVLDTFLGFDPETLCSLPAFNFVRAAYAVVALVKLHSIASQPERDLSSIIDKDELQVEVYLQQLQKSLQAAVQTKKSKIASIFHLILQMLQMWFQRQCQTHVTSCDENRIPPDQSESHHGGSDQLTQSLTRDHETSAAFGLQEPEVEATEGAEFDFRALFEMNNGRLFETALGWMGGLA